MFCNRRPFQANRDAGIREAECEKAAMDVKYSTGGVADIWQYFR